MPIKESSSLVDSYLGRSKSPERPRDEVARDIEEGGDVGEGGVGEGVGKVPG